MKTDNYFIQELLKEVEESKHYGSKYILERKITEILEQHRGEIIEELRQDICGGYCQFYEDGDCDIEKETF